MTSPFEVDQDALQSLITLVNAYEQDFETLESQLTSAYTNFDSGFMSPMKSQLEQTWNDLNSIAQQFTSKIQEVKTGLQNLQQQATIVGQVTF